MMRSWSGEVTTTSLPELGISVVVTDIERQGAAEAGVEVDHMVREHCISAMANRLANDVMDGVFNEHVLMRVSLSTKRVGGNEDDESLRIPTAERTPHNATEYTYTIMRDRLAFSPKKELVSA